MCKTCTKCKRNLPFEDFPRDGHHTDGTVRRRRICKPCKNKRAIEYRRKNGDARRESRQNASAKAMMAVAAYEDVPYDPYARELLDAGPLREWVGGRLRRGLTIEELGRGDKDLARKIRRIYAEGQVRLELNVLDQITMANDVTLWEVGY